MKTGFKNLDEIINIEEPQLILMTGINNAEALSGDIANDLSLKQECEVLEIVRCKKEYLIKRLIINECNVDYNKWTAKERYSPVELEQIGRGTVNLIELTKRLPTIIEQEIFNLNEVTKIVSNFANKYSGREEVKSLVVLDVFPLAYDFKNDKQNRRDTLKLIKKLKNISKKLRCPIIIVDSVDLTKKFKNYKSNYLVKDDIDNISKINKLVDKFIILNPDNEHADIYNVDVYNANDKVGTCKLLYNVKCRKFENFE